MWTIGSIEGGSGNVVRVGGDGSTLFVQGYGGMYTARYRQTGLGARAAAPPAAAARRGTARADEPGRELERPRQD